MWGADEGLKTMDDGRWTMDEEGVMTDGDRRKGSAVRPLTLPILKGKVGGLVFGQEPAGRAPNGFLMMVC